MALPVANLIQAAVEVLVTAPVADKTREGTRALMSDINSLCGKLNRLYSTLVGADITVTDATDAGVSEFIGGGEGDDYAVGSIFRVLGTGDLTDNAMATAKGSAVASGDVFVIDGADSIEYLGAQTDLTVPTHAFDFFGETEADFMSIGS